MIRDFSNTTRQRILECLEDSSLFVDDINYAALYGCTEAEAEDYAPFAADVENYIMLANNVTLSDSSFMETIKGEINRVFDETQKLDTEYVPTIEDDMSLTLENYMSDLQTLIDAIAVGGVGDTQREILENLGKSDGYDIFENSSDFKMSLVDVNNPLYNEFCVQFINSYGEYDYEAMANFVAENEDVLSLWELEFFKNVLDSYVNTETGEVNTDGVENFLEAMYYTNEYGEEPEQYEYNLSEEYAQIFLYYNSHVQNELQLHNGQTTSEGVPYCQGISDLNAILNGVYQFNQTIYTNVYELDDETSVWNIDNNGNPYPNELNIEINDIVIDADDEMTGVTISAAHQAGDSVTVYHFGPLGEQMTQAVIEELEDQIVNPNDAYAEAVSSGWGSYIQSIVTGPITDLLPDSVQNVVEIAGIYTSGEEAYQQQVQENAQIQSEIDWIECSQDMYDANANGNVIVCGSESTITNVQIK